MKFLLLSCILALTACSGIRPTQASDGNASSNDNTRIAVQNPQHLADYLRHVPGLIVSTNSVRLRGGGVPLYIVDEVPIGSSYSRVNSMVNVLEIDRVEVPRDAASRAMYGFRGQNGIVKIYTRK